MHIFYIIPTYNTHIMYDSIILQAKKCIMINDIFMIYE